MCVCVFFFLDFVDSELFLSYQFDNNVNGYYIAPAFMDKLLVHIAKNFMKLPNIKVYNYYPSL